MALPDLLAQMVAMPQAEGSLSFCEVHTPERWNDVQRFRLEQYEKLLPYMLNELDPSGSDEFDTRSYLFAACWNDKVVGTIRLTPHPFETSRYVSDDKLTRFLGPHWHSEYLEWSRFLIDLEAPVRRLMPALLAYAGLRVLLMTSYTRYFGYASTRVQPLFGKFRMTPDEETFSIPKRGDHGYVLLKGDFADSFNHFIERLRAPVLAALSLYRSAQSN